MKRILASLLVIIILLGCTACGSVHTCENPCESCGLCLSEDCLNCPEKCPGHHSCSSVCNTCGLCINTTCTEFLCLEKCPGHHECISPCGTCGLCTNADCTEADCSDKCLGHAEIPYEFPAGDYITTEAVSIDTGTFVYDIGENIYVRGDLQEITDVIVPLMEEVSGLDFDGTGYAQGMYSDGKIHINLTRDNLYAGQDWYHGRNDNELGSAYASSYYHVNLSPGDLYLGNSALIHEAAHVLMFRQSEWSHCQMLNEGISTYTTYLVEKALAESDHFISLAVDNPQQSINDVNITYYKALYDQPLEFWFTNSFEYSMNANYAIGFRFMAYLQDTYGEYTSWITKFEELYSCKTHRNYTNESPVEKQIEVLKATYGNDVLDNFYPWLKEHQDLFEQDSNLFRDLSNAGGINLYPTFNAVSSYAMLKPFRYNDLYINIETVRTYVEDYKQQDASALTLILSSPATVNLYRNDGSYHTEHGTKFSLDGISYIKLLGQGELNYLEVQGPFTRSD